MYNPFASYGISGDWASHLSYSLGGTDYPLSWGTDIKAPASGTLRTSGGSGEYRAGWVSSAGRRSILTLDTPIRNLVALVFQHQSAFGENGKHYDQGAVLGVSGDSGFTEHDATDHLHIHGLTAGGMRLQFETYIETATAGLKPVDLKGAGKMKLILHRVGGNMAYYAASDTQLIGPIVMGAERLRGVLAVYGPAVEVWGDGLLGVQDVIDTNNALNKAESVYAK